METSRTLQDIIETLEDGRKGFEKGADKLEQDGHPDLAGTFRKYAEQRGHYSAELRELASRKGIDIDESGSMAGALHRGWLALKDAVAGDDPVGVLAAAEQGEDHAVSEYEKALDGAAAVELDTDVRETLAHQLAGVRAAHDEVRAMRDRFEA